MNVSQSMVVAAFGLGLLAAGCSAPSDAMEAADMEAPSFETLDGPEGGGTQNGLRATAFHDNEVDLRAAANSPLLGAGSAVHSDIVNTGIFAAPGGPSAFEYAVKCGAPDGAIVEYGSDVFEGQGLLSTTAGWTLSALTDPQEEDLFTCLAAQMNAYGFEVPILLTGPSIQSNGEYPTYTFLEALWLAEIDASGGIHFSVWPLQDLQDKCGSNTSEWLNLRICGSFEGGCGVTVNSVDDIADDCTPVGVKGAETGRYMCKGKPAIQTWLPEDSIARLYGNCEPPPQ